MDPDRPFALSRSMSDRPIHDELAAGLFRHVAGEAPASASTAVAVEAASRRLRAELADTLGTGGATALFVRALHRAKRDHPLLGTVTVEPSKDGGLSGLGEAMAAATDRQAAAAGTAILAELFVLLVTFLGEDLGLQPVFKFWPQLRPRITEIEA